MPRQAREKSGIEVYHVMLRGINQQQIFEDERDNEEFIEVIGKVKEISKFQLYAYCLMGNHVHLLLKVETEELEQIFKRIGVRYVQYYNFKYKRVGHLFQDRFKSEPIEDDRYLLAVLRYIHQNPLKAGLCKKIDGYKWNSYKEYMTTPSITDTSFILDIIAKERNLYIKKLRIKGLSIRQISRLTGISKRIVENSK